jgi:hemoglobin/transferrin/lactoferrin receptor protein
MLRYDPRMRRNARVPALTLVLAAGSWLTLPVASRSLSANHGDRAALKTRQERPAPAPVEKAAEGTDPDDSAARVFETITVLGSGVEQPLAEVAGTVTVLRRQDLDRRLALDLSDAVLLEPGVAVTADAGRFGNQSFRMRGVEGNRVAIEIDGMAVAEAFAVGSFSNAGRLGIEPELLASIEILRGPASALHGGDALGGVVALRTIDPIDLLPADREKSFTLRSAADSRDRSLRQSLLFAASAGSWQGLVLATGRRGHQRETNGTIAANPANTAAVTGFLKLARPVASGRLELILDRQDRRTETDVRHLRNGPGQFATTELLLADDRVRRSRLSLAQFLSPGTPWFVEGSWRLHWLATDTAQETDQWRRPDRSTPQPTKRERRFDLVEQRRAAQFTARSRFATGRAAHDLAWGAEWGESRTEEKRDGREINLTTGAATNVVIGERLPVRDFPNSTTRETGLFLADSIALGASGWRFLPALRHDRYRSRARPDALYREDNPGLEVVDGDDQAWTPKLGILWDLPRRHGVYLQVTEGFRAPPVSDLNIGFTIPAFNFAAVPNPSLRAETSRGFEAGWRYAGRTASAQIAWYDNRYRHLIESRANLGRDPFTGLTLFQSVNRDRARIRGFEATARFDLPHRLTCDLAAARSRGDDTRRRVPLNTIDPDRLTVAVRYDSVGGLWSTQAIAGLVASQRGRVDRSAADLFVPPGYETLDFFAELRLTSKLRGTVGLRNVFDRKYWSWGSLKGVLAGDPLLDLYADPGRSAQLGIQLEF